ncbi:MULTISPECIES: site-specific integrase [unclassified Mesorhizobium]|uniref:site-specific integrase n=1 Tax=unclassified Mesorhizobium TaxID=325217 RepID=UPI000FC99808|nr:MULTISPECIES: site-specific integrase [unclassified Mesorhizobium]TGP21432.1 site-specific integrase [Mesorhizobium sp. M1D.F.Ca.ET.231.01.1.1]TGP28879.1 site-specific integrase [Mesorhizobium sp. M1D.F.Ca.ET.234.01.1.1]TGS43347.1 site-specific integrase [Mesorhizobium sp. M1D.F.Ca.ET.184.01.1.1]TGS59895.1 site-specific integrase [Mesorhizobium sp. M1D.F.Ca.ET.183.01.1.1]
MAVFSELKPKNRAQRPSGPSHSTATEDDVSAARPSAETDAPGTDDLPDIVDVVMAMGRAAEEPADGVPSPPLPAAANPQLPAHLEALAGRARDYVEAASSTNTRRAYAADWKHFASWCRRQGVELFPPDPQVVGLYITACASGKATGDKKPNCVSTIERRLSSLTWNFSQRGQPLDRKDRHIATVMAGIRNKHAAPPRQKEAILPEDLIAMLETLERGSLRGLRDRAMLLLGFAGGLRRSEIVALDVGRAQTEDGRGWIEILEKGMLVSLRGKTGWREVEVGRGSSDATCPIVAVQTWLKLARIAHGPLFRRVTGQGKAVGADRLNDQEVARLVKRTALAAGVRGDLPEGERGKLFAGHSLRAGLASSAEVDERYVQKQLGHTSAEMTRRYQRRRDRFRVNLTKASGL